MKYKLRNKYTTDPQHALTEILQSRGVTDIEGFIHPSSECELDPYGLENIEAGARMLLRHLQENHRILVVVDADADGFTSASILWLYIKNVFPDARLEFTVHSHKQHGLSDKIEWIEDNPNFELVVCPDASSYDIQEHQRLGELGIEVLVLDHHAQEYNTAGQPIVSNGANVIVINNQLSPRYENKSLCGAGVVYKFCEVLDDMLEIEQARKYLDLAALGEIADVMDRTNTETNYIMLEGLRHIENKGLQTLIEGQSFSLKEKAVYPYPGLTPIDIAFYIAPLVNAITRVGTLQDKEALFYCFVEPDRPMQSTKRGAKRGDIELAADQASRVGANAKAKQNRIKDKAIETIDWKVQKDDLLQNNLLLVEVDQTDEIPQEMTGLVAMAMVSKYHKPCMVGRRNNKNEIQGSIRSDSNFSGLPSFKQFLEESKLVSYVAGHDGAAGFGISGNKADQLVQYANESLNPADFENCYTVDYILDAREDNAELLAVLAAHPEYFGNHIDEIKLVIKNISVGNALAMGANKDSMKVSYNGIDYVRFKDDEFVEQVGKNHTNTLTVYGRANLNVFLGKTNIQCFVDDYQFEVNNSKYDF